MAGKNQSCPGCGYKIRRPDGFLTNYKGKSWHIGCLEIYLKGKQPKPEVSSKGGKKVLLEGGESGRRRKRLVDFLAEI